MTQREKRHVYVSTVKDGGLRGVVRDAVTGEVLVMSEKIDPPHLDVAKARAAELFREHVDAWHLIDEPTKEGT